MVRNGWLLAAAMGLACGEASMRSPRSDAAGNGAAPADTDLSPPSVDDSTSTGASPRAAFYGLRLAFDTVEGEIVEGTATVSVDLWSDESPPAVLCRHRVPVLDALSEEVPELDTLQVDEFGAGGLAGWWQLDLDAGAPQGVCSEWPPRTLWFGLGPYDTRLDPALSAAGLFDSDLFGLYLQEDLDDGVYVVGVGGTGEMFAGEPGPDPASLSLPDGAYTAESLVLMAL